MNEKPICYGYYPLRFPYIQAEKCCDDCPWNATCFEERKEKDDVSVNS